jgi:hypothetical protein
MQKPNSSLNEESKKEEFNSLLSNIDNISIEEIDPSLTEGHRLSFDREVPLELRLDENEGIHEVASFEAIRVKMLILGEETNPSQIRIELSCENDLFFHFTSEYFIFK